MPARRERLLIAVVVLFATVGLGLLMLAGSTPLADSPPTPPLPLGEVSFTSGVSAGWLIETALAPTDYVHPSGAFTIAYPLDWQIDEAENEVRFVGPNDEAEIVVWFAAPEQPVKLDAFLQRWLEDRYGGFANYAAGKQITLEDGSLLQVASFTGDDQIHRATDAFGEERGGILYVESFVAMTGLHDDYLPLFMTVANSFQYNAAGASGLASPDEGR